MFGQLLRRVGLLLLVGRKRFVDQILELELENILGAEQLFEVGVDAHKLTRILGVARSRGGLVVVLLLVLGCSGDLSGSRTLLAVAFVARRRGQLELLVLGFGGIVADHSFRWFGLLLISTGRRGCGLAGSRHDRAAARDVLKTSAGLTAERGLDGAFHRLARDALEDAQSVFVLFAKLLFETLVAEFFNKNI